MRIYFVGLDRGLEGGVHASSAIGYKHSSLSTYIPMSQRNSLPKQAGKIIAENSHFGHLRSPNGSISCKAGNLASTTSRSAITPDCCEHLIRPPFLGFLRCAKREFYWVAVQAMLQQDVA